MTRSSTMVGRAWRPVAFILIVSPALCGCGGSVQGSPQPEDGAVDVTDGATDATDSGVRLFPDGSFGDADATSPPPEPDSSVDASQPFDGSFFPDALCGSATCPLGCCAENGECIEPPNDSHCGGWGSPCQVCEAGPCAGTACAVIQETCGPSNCAGCCIGQMSFGDAAQTICMVGTDAVFCGSGGSGCRACGPGQECRPFGFTGGGFCQSNNTCDPSNCTGCCIDNVCAQGNQAIACGVGGVVCKSCGDGGICTNGNCECGGLNAPPCPDE